MNFFSFFTKKPQQDKEPKGEEDNIKIIISLREQIALLEKRKDVIKMKQEDITENAKLKAKNGDKKGALLLLNQRKKNETEMDNIIGSQVLLENQLFTLESAAMNKETFNVLRVGNDAIKQINKGLTPDVIDEIMDDIQETQDTSQQIQTMLNAPLQTIYEDAELLAELEGLYEEEPAVLKLPSVPSVPTRLPVIVEEENDEIMTSNSDFVEYGVVGAEPLVYK
jgi:hypothetical protein